MVDNRYWQSQFEEDFKYVPELKIKLIELQAIMKDNGDTVLLEYLQMDQL